MKTRFEIALDVLLGQKQEKLPFFQAFEKCDEDLAKQAKNGLEVRFRELSLASQKQVYLDGVSYELGVIENMGFSGYFLIVADIVKWAKAEGIYVGPGRDSGAGSLAFALTITDLDPIKYSLLFEDFLIHLEYQCLILILTFVWTGAMSYRLCQKQVW